MIFFVPTGRSIRCGSATMLDEQSGELKSGYLPAGTQRKGIGWHGGLGCVVRNDFPPSRGGASRFFYTAKADRKDRGEGNNHPTVKPQDLMAWLIKLLTRPGAVVLDCFSGSGTTVLVADKLGRIGVGLDAKFEYCKMARKRIVADAPLLANVHPGPHTL